MMRCHSLPLIGLLGDLVAVVALVAAGASSSPLAATAQATAGSDDEVASLIAALRPGERVRLLAPGISIQDGVVVSASVDLLSVLEESQRWEVTPRAVERLLVRERSTYRTLLGGALFGAATGFGMGYFYEKLVCDTGGGCGSHIIISAGAIGTLLGGGGGAVLGYRSVSWRQRFP